MYRQLLQSLYINLINLEKGTSASTRKGSLNLERDTEICKAQARVNKLTASLMALIIDSLQGSTEKLKRCGHSKQWWTDTLKSKSKKSRKVKHKPKPRSAVKNFPIRWAKPIPNVRMIFCVLGTSSNTWDMLFFVKEIQPRTAGSQLTRKDGTPTQELSKTIVCLYQELFPLPPGSELISIPPIPTKNTRWPKLKVTDIERPLYQQILYKAPGLDNTKTIAMKKSLKSRQLLTSDF